MKLQQSWPDRRPKLPVLPLDSDHLRSTGHGTDRLRAAPKGGEKAGGERRKTTLLRWPPVARVCLGERHERRVWLWLWSCRLPVLWFGLVNACLPLPCRVAHAAGHMAACRGALGRLRPGLARSNRPGTGRGTESAAGSRTEPCRASPLVLVLPSARLWRLGADRPTDSAGRWNQPLAPVCRSWSRWRGRCPIRPGPGEGLFNQPRIAH